MVLPDPITASAVLLLQASPSHSHPQPYACQAIVTSMASDTSYRSTGHLHRYGCVSAPCRACRRSVRVTSTTTTTTSQSTL